MLDKTILCKGELGFPEEIKQIMATSEIFSHSHIILHFLVRAGISPREAFLAVFLTGTGHTTNLMSWRLMIVWEVNGICALFPNFQPFGGSGSTRSDIGSHLTPFPPVWTLDVTTAWKVPYFKTLGRGKTSPTVSEQAGLGDLPDCFKVIKQPSQNCCSSS